jgi:hypothetical protein
MTAELQRLVAEALGRKPETMLEIDFGTATRAPEQGGSLGTPRRSRASNPPSSTAARSPLGFAEHDDFERFGFRSWP